jgi:F1F0 ATPase subunit 2
MDAQAMMNFPFTGHQLYSHLISAGIWLTVGAFIGTLHFLTLQWNVRLLAADKPFTLALVTQLARFALTAGLLSVIAGHFGAFALLVAALGILAARMTVIRFG